jgi:four helix bundle protein
VKDKCNFYNIAQGSLEESRYYLILAKDLGYLVANDGMLNDLDEAGTMLHGLVISITTR